MAENARHDTDPLSRLIAEFGRLPGIGRRTAEKLAYHMLNVGRDEALKLAAAIEDVKTNVNACTVCFNLTDVDPCRICADPHRDAATLCVVEQPKDLASLEKAGMFSGHYHVLTGRVAPLDGVGPDDLTISALVDRVRASQATDSPITEVILATNPDFEGDGTALYVTEALAPTGVSVSRLARGMPTGSAIEFSSSAILTDALRGRQVVSPPRRDAPTDADTIEA